MNPETPKELAAALARDAEAVCRELLKDGKREGNEWVALNPSRADKNLGSFRILLVNGNKPAGFWKDFATDQSGDLLDLWCLVCNCDLGEAMRQARNFLGLQPPPILKKSAKTYVKLKRPPASRPAQTESVVTLYFSGRGITEETLKAFHILEQPNSWSKHPDNPADIVFPYLLTKSDGTLELFNNKYLAIKREADGKKITRLEKDARLGLFGWHLIKPDARKVLICEGEVDAMTWHQIGAAVLSVPNGVSGGKKKPGEDENDWLEIEEPRLARFDEIFISFDMDAPGRESAPRLIHRLGRHRCRNVTLPHKDANECLQQGMTTKDFAQCLRQAEYLRPEEFITFQEGIEIVKTTRRQNAERGGVPEGMMLPWRKATKFWMTPGQLTVWTGYSGHGKTTLVSHVLVAAIPKGERVCIASLEMTINDTVDRMCKQATGRADLSDTELDKLGTLIEDRVVVYTHIGTSNLDTVLEIFLYARRRHGCTQLVVDSLMMLGIGHDDYDAQLKAVQKLITFAHEHHCHIHLIIHPKKPKDESESPGMYDIKGSGGLVDNAPNVVTVWRNKKKYDAQQDEIMNGIPMDAKLISAPDTTLSIRKNRYNGWQATIPLWFNEASQQFLESPTEYPMVYLQPNAEENF